MEWHGSATVAGSGMLTFSQAFATASNGYPANDKPLVRKGSIAVTKAGTVTLTLVPTAAGTTALSGHESIKLNLSITFRPTGGRSTTKLLHLILRK